MRRPPDPREVASAYDAAAATFDAAFARDPATQRRFRRIEAIQRGIAAGAGRVLELGCGTGRLLGELDARVTVGVDVSAGLLARAAARGLSVARADAHALPFPDGCFDAIVGGNAVFRYLDYERALRECRRVLAPRGRLAVHQYARACWTRRGLQVVPGPSHLHVDDPAELIEPARALGFTVQAVERWRSIRLPPYAVRVPRIAGRMWSHVTVVFTR